MTNKTSSPHPAKSGKPKQYLLRLFMAGNGLNSQKALFNLRAICKEHLNGNCRIETVDVVKNFQAAVKENILITPALIMVTPLPKVMILGNLSDHHKVLQALRLGGGWRMKPIKPTYQQLEKRLATIEPIIAALKHHEVDAVVGQERLAFLLLKEVQEELVSSDAGFRAMFELSGVGMVQADSPSFRFIKFNPTFCEMTGYSVDELATQTFISLARPQDRQQTMKTLTRVLRGKTDSWSLESRILRKDGTEIWIGLNGSALRDDAGKAVKIMAMVSDITGRKAAERKLDDRSRELRNLASELALAQQRERRRIAQMLHNHIEELLLGARRRKAPARSAGVKTLREALQDVQDFIKQSIAPPRDTSDEGKPIRHRNTVDRTTRANGGPR